MKLGIGVITTPSRVLDMPKRGIERSDLKVGPDTEVFVHLDVKYQGVAYSRNKCIKHLYDLGCDYIAICDDDLIFLMDGWLDLCASIMQQNKLDVACLPDVLQGQRKGATHSTEFWTAYIGAFYILSRKAIEELGYFSEAFKGYGFEDVHYKYRYKLWTRAFIRIPKILPYLIASKDVLNYNHPSSIPDKELLIERNRKIFDKEIANGHIFYPYPGN